MLHLPFVIVVVCIYQDASCALKDNEARELVCEGISEVEEEKLGKLQGGVVRVRGGGDARTKALAARRVDARIGIGRSDWRSGSHSELEWSKENSMYNKTHYVQVV